MKTRPLFVSYDWWKRVINLINNKLNYSNAAGVIHQDYAYAINEIVNTRLDEIENYGSALKEELWGCTQSEFDVIETKWYNTVKRKIDDKVLTRMHVYWWAKWGIHQWQTQCLGKWLLLSASPSL